MNTAVMEKTTTKAIARPLSTLVPLIKKAMAEEQRTSMERRREVGILLLEAQQSMKDDGTFYKPRPNGGATASGKWGKWLSKNFKLSFATATQYMRLGALPASSAATFSSVRAAIADPSTRRVRNGGDGRKSRAQKLVEYLTDGGEERIEEFSKSMERDRKQEEKQENAIEQVMAEIIKVGFAKLLERYSPDKNKSATTETFDILMKARERLREVLR